MKIENIVLGGTMITFSKLALTTVPFGNIVCGGLILSGIGNVIYGSLKSTDKNIKKINDLFKDIRFKNTKGQYAYVKYVKEYDSYNLYRIIIPDES